MKTKNLNRLFILMIIFAIICLLFIIFILISPTKTFKDITYLDIDLKTSKLTIKNGQTFNVSYNKKKTNIKIENNKLLIKEKGEDSIIITMPSSTKFAQAYFYLGEGELNIEHLETDFFDLGTCSEANIEELIVNNKIDIGGCNNLIIKDSLINNIDLLVLDSNINISGTFEGKNEINGGTGDLTINLKDDDYKYILSNIEGSLQINDHLIKNESIYGNGNKKIIINDSYGKIRITTKE